MSNALKALTVRMRRDVLSSRYVGLFAEARQRQETLGRYEATADVLKALSNDRSDAYAERESLTRALLVEHRKHESTLWSALLVVAYYPMLSCLRFRLINERLTSDDLDQLVLLAFLFVLDRIPFERVRDRLALRLRQRTTRRLFKIMPRQSGLEALTECDDADAIDRAPTEPTKDSESLGCRLILMDLRRTVGDEVSDLAIGTIGITILDGEDLKGFVKRVVASDPLEQSRTYQRLKRQRTRALSTLRRLVSPNDELFERSA